MGTYLFKVLLKYFTRCTNQLRKLREQELKLFMSVVRVTERVLQEPKAYLITTLPFPSVKTTAPMMTIDTITHLSIV